ncbi:MAG TPA: hypothetical protein PLE11_12385, partial [Bacteroidales bacterium]|nr:hypothetical protein [Bacteroidales bacterium]
MLKIKTPGLALIFFLLIFGTGAAQTFSPSQIPGLSLWLRADSNVILNGSNVSQWSDCSGNNNNAAQASAVNQPLLDSGQLNGYPVLRFDGNDDFMEFASGFMYNWPELSFFIVIKPFSSGNQGIFAPTNAYSTGLEFLSWTGTTQLRINNNLKYGAGLITNGTFTISDFTYNNAATNGYANGVTLTSATGGNPLDFNGVYALGRIYSTGYNAAFDVAEILAYNRTVSLVERNEIEQYLRLKYARQIDLGPDIYAYGFS